jgi:hypothetical protein
MVVRLRDLVDAGTVLRMCDADRDDLALLALIEDSLRKTAPGAEAQ